MRVETVERLVEQHQLHRADECGRQADTLPHAERQLAAGTLRDLRERELVEDGGRSVRGGAARFRDEADVLFDGEELVERGRLIREADLRARRARCGREILAVATGPTCRRPRTRS
jgi:hypothetical protein